MTSNWRKDYPLALALDETVIDENSSLKKMLPLIGEHKRVIDFGCATGYLAQLLTKRGCQVTGVEVNPKAAKIAEQYCEKVIVADLDFVALPEILPSQEFDVAVFGDVLEHLRNPWKVLEETQQLLKPEGYVVASIPNFAHGNIRLALLQGRFEYMKFGILDDTHIRFFTNKTVQELFKRSGYSIDVIERTKLPMFSSSPWIPDIDKNDFNSDIVHQIEQEEDADTLQFVLRGFPLSLENRYTVLNEKYHKQVDELEQSQLQLQQTQVELERARVYLQETWQNAQTERERLQSQLQQTQVELEQARIYLQETWQNAQTERERLQSQLQQTQVELEQAQLYLQDTEQNVQTERQQFQIQLQKKQAELEQKKVELQQIQAAIAAMHTSKFWKLRTQWFKFKAKVKALVKWNNQTRTIADAQPPFHLQQTLEQESQSLVPDEGLLALSDVSCDLFWQILDPVIQTQISSHDHNSTPKISILTPTFNSSLDWFVETALSVLYQSIPDWEWCIVDDGSKTDEIRSVLSKLAQKHPRIKVALQESGGISSATNKALEMASGDYICFLDHDDTLTVTALEDSLDKLSQGFDITYSDEDKIDVSGLHYVESFFKPDWSPEYFRGVMYVGHLLCVSKNLAIAVGGLNSEYDGVQDYEFMLRLSEITQNIGHIPKILYHWRKVPGSIAGDIHAKPAIEKLQQAAVNAHLKRLNLLATARELGNHRLSIIPSPRTHNPLISIIIPTKNAAELLERCLKSIFSISTYPNFEVLLVDNETSDAKALQVMKQFPVKRLHFPNPFNYSRANNLGANYAQGEYLVFLNNDTEVLAQDWLQNLLYYAEQPDVGAVGSLLLFPDRTVQHAGVVLGVRGTADHLMRGFSSDVDGYAGSLVCAREVSSVTAACMMLRKSDFEQVGCFNEHFFTHYQDVDLCMRLIAVGRRIIFTPRATLIHYESATRKDYYDLIDRNLLLDQWYKYIEQGDMFYNPNFDNMRYDYTVKQQ